eukprot:TRINITY_DN9450_c0_g1_i1.p1 TRINITY_DN9450_c0_g1~~TRINITY_DN9450_c0_g1_i1.p1  ORF type:complete len:1074 (+),score=329.02 TRINITY_DN9450_c0_g1_i1:356-3223(+)
MDDQDMASQLASPSRPPSMVKSKKSSRQESAKKPLTEQQLLRLKKQEREQQKRNTARLIRNQKNLKLKASHPQVKGLSHMKAIFERKRIAPVSPSRQNARPWMQSISTNVLSAKPLLGLGLGGKRRGSQSQAPINRDVMIQLDAHKDATPTLATVEHRSDLTKLLKEKVTQERRALFEKDEAIRRVDEEDFEVPDAEEAFQAAETNDDNSYSDDSDNDDDYNPTEDADKTSANTVGHDDGADDEDRSALPNPETETAEAKETSNTERTGEGMATELDGKANNARKTQDESTADVSCDADKTMPSVGGLSGDTASGRGTPTLLPVTTDENHENDDKCADNQAAVEQQADKASFEPGQEVSPLAFFGAKAPKPVVDEPVKEHNRQLKATYGRQSSVPTLTSEDTTDMFHGTVGLAAGQHSRSSMADSRSNSRADMHDNIDHKDKTNNQDLNAMELEDDAPALPEPADLDSLPTQADTQPTQPKGIALDMDFDLGLLTGGAADAFATQKEADAAPKTSTGSDETSRLPSADNIDTQRLSSTDKNEKDDTQRLASVESNDTQILENEEDEDRFGEKGLAEAKKATAKGFVDQEADESGEETMETQLEADDEDDNDDNLADMIDDGDNEGDTAALAACQRQQDDEDDLGQFAHLLQPKRDLLDDEAGEDKGSKDDRELTAEEQARVAKLKREAKKRRRRKRAKNSMPPPEEPSEAVSILLGNKSAQDTQNLFGGDTQLLESDLESQEDTDDDNDQDLARQERLHDFRDFLSRDTSRMDSMSALLDEDSQQLKACVRNHNSIRPGQPVSRSAHYRKLNKSRRQSSRTASKSSSGSSRRGSSRTRGDSPPRLMREGSNSRSAFLQRSPRTLKRLKSVVGAGSKGSSAKSSFVFRTTSADSQADAVVSPRRRKQEHPKRHAKQAGSTHARPQLKRSRTAPASNVFTKHSAALRNAFNAKPKKA